MSLDPALRPASAGEVMERLTAIAPRLVDLLDATLGPIAANGAAGKRIR